MRVSRFFAVAIVCSSFAAGVVACSSGSETVLGPPVEVGNQADSGAGVRDSDTSEADSGSSIDSATATDATIDDGGEPDDAGDDASALEGDAGDAGSVDSGLPSAFGPAFNGEVRALLHAGNAWFVGGLFSSAGAFPAPKLIELTDTGAPVAACNFGAGFGPASTARVSAVLRVGAAVYVGGTFSTYQGSPTNNLAKLDATTCALDTTFSPPASNGFNSTVRALASSGTALYVGGAFSAYRGVVSSAVRLAKIDLTSGAIDTTFGPPGTNLNGFDTDVYALAVAGSSLYAGGTFSKYRGVVGSASNLAKLDLVSGAIDTTFSPAGATSNGFNGNVYALATSGSSLYVGGVFTVYKNVANSANRIAKLNLTSGALDAAFSPVGATANGVNGNVNALVVAGTSLYVGGAFSQYKGVANAANRLAKLDLTTGAIDTAFSPVGASTNGFDGAVSALAASATSLYVGGVFSQYKGVVESANGLAKLDLTSGAIDNTFVPAGHSVRGVDETVNALAVSGSQVWAGGGFTTYAGIRVNNIAKFDDKTFALDTVFSPPGAGTNGFSNTVNALASSGNALYVGGSFSQYRGVANSARRVAKLDMTSGAIDTTFSPAGATLNGFDAPVNALALVSGALYVGGEFAAYKGVATSANRLAKLDAVSGAIDTVFSPVGASANGFNGNVNALVVANGALYVGGGFTAYRGVVDSAQRLAKLNATSGSLDSTFSPAGAAANGFDGDVNALTTSSTALYVGGVFTAYRGAAGSANRIAKLDLADGAIDAIFSPSVSNGFNSSVLALAISGSALYAGGQFDVYRGVADSAHNIARLEASTGAIDAAFSPAGAFTNGVDAQVSALSADAIGVVLGGQFTTYRASVYAPRLLTLAASGLAIR